MVDRRLDGIKIGHVTAEDIYSGDGNLLVKEGTIISYELISKLKKHKVNYRDILSTISKEYKEPDLIPVKDMDTSISAVQRVFDDVMSPEKKSTESAIPDENI